MRLTLSPHLFYQGGKRYPYVPLGLISVATAARKQGWDVSFVDPNRMVTLEEDSVAEAIVEQAPDLVGLGGICGTYPSTLMIAMAIKERLESVPIVLGGAQASATARETLAEVEAVDYVLTGESEFSFPRLLALLEGRDGLAPGDVPGLYYREGCKIAFGPPSSLIDDIDAFPLLDYHLYPYWLDGKAIPVEVGRGCPYGCTYCATTQYWKRRFRLFSVERVVDQIESLYTAGGRRFDLVHDIFTFDKAWVRSFCNLLRERVPDAIWDASTRLDALDSALIEEMREAGCTSLFFGVETGSARMQTLIGKRLNLEKASHVLNAVGESGIKATASFIIGFPNERISDLKQTVDMILDLACGPHRPYIVQVHLLAPLAESSLFKQLGESVRYFGREAVQSFAGAIDAETEAWVRSQPRLFAPFHGYPHPVLERAFLARLALFLRAVQCLPVSLFIARSRMKGAFVDLLIDMGEVLAKMDRVTNPDDITDMANSAAEVLISLLDGMGDDCGWMGDIISFEALLRAKTGDRATISEPSVFRSHYDCKSFVEAVTSSEAAWLLPDDPEPSEKPMTSLVWRENERTRTLVLPFALADQFSQIETWAVRVRP